MRYGKAKKRPPYNLKSRITSALRKVWLWSPHRRAAVAIAKERGNTCADCGDAWDRLDIDHVRPVVGVEGFQDWATYIDRLFNGELTALCKPCHKVKTDDMRRQRNAYKKRQMLKATKKKKRKLRKLLRRMWL